MSGEVVLEPFHSSYEDLQKLAHTSWRDEYGINSFPDLYHPAYLDYLFRPVKDPDLLIGGYVNGELVCFFANLPRKYSLRGKPLTGVLSCLLMTRLEYLRKGIAITLIKQAEKLNHKFHFDFSMLYLESGHRSSKLFNKLRAKGDPLEKVKKMSVIGRILDLEKANKSENLKIWERTLVKLIGAANEPPKQPNPNVRPYTEADLPRCLELLERFRDTATLARVWTEGELKWELSYEGVSYTLVHEKQGRVNGIINYVIHEHISEHTEPWAWINQVEYSDLSHKERKAFLNEFLRRAKEQGCIGAVEWTKNVYPTRPLWSCRFIPYFRSVDMLAWLFNRDLHLEGIKDVYEVQI